jgi:AcrR family transcriptional regulator
MEIKERLLEVTMELIKEKKGNLNDITIREIAKRAETGVGLVNYHFQSKENLIYLCVQKIISGVIMGTKPYMEQLSPMEKLKTSVKIPIDFLMENPDISKISILGDFIQGQQNDNTFKTLARYYHYASGVDASEDIFFKTVFLIHGLQGIFLRRELYKDTFDFSNKGERDRLIDTLVEEIFGGENGTK